MRWSISVVLLAVGCGGPREVPHDDGSAVRGPVPSDRVPSDRVAGAEPIAAFEGERPDASARTWSFTVVSPAGERLALVGHAIGRGGYAVRELSANGFARGLNVLTPTWVDTGAWLAFEFVPALRDGARDPNDTDDWRVALAEGRGDAFHVVATSDHDAAAWADWAVASPDGSRVAAWVLDERDGVLHVMERRGDALVVVDRRHADAVKCFPRFAPNGRLAARLPLRGDPLRYANAIDGVVGEPLRAAREVHFDATGERWAYAGRRAAGWFVFAGTGPEPAAEAGPFDEVDTLDFGDASPIPPLARARVRDASGWRWVELERP